MQLSPSSGSDLNTRGAFQLASLTSLLWPQNPTENVCVTVLHVAFVIESVVILPRPKSDIIIRFLRPRLEHGTIDFTATLLLISYGPFVVDTIPTPTGKSEPTMHGID